MGGIPSRRVPGAEQRRGFATPPSGCDPIEASASAQATAGSRHGRCVGVEMRVRAFHVPVPALSACIPGGADQGYAEIEVPRRRERAVDDVPRRLVAAHGVDGNPDHQGFTRFTGSQGSRVRKPETYSSSTARAWRPR